MKIEAFVGESVLGLGKISVYEFYCDYNDAEMV